MGSNGWQILSGVIHPFACSKVNRYEEMLQVFQFLGNNSPLLFRREPLTPDNVL